MSLILSIDGQKLDSGNSTTLWTGAQSFTLAVWFKKANDLYAGIFGVLGPSSPERNNVNLRFSYERFDHGLKLGGVDIRMDASAQLTSGWNLAVLTINSGVELKSYLNGAFQHTMAIAGFPWIGPASRIIVGSHTMNSWDTGRGKIAHAALWDTLLSDAQVADLYNGGAGGAGKNPLAVASANLRTYLPLISNATDEKGTFTMTATGAPAYDGADNPNVEAYGGGDVTAPLLSSASVTAIGATTGTGNVTTNEGNGTLYSIVSTSATAPSAAQIQAGQSSTGVAATWSGNQIVDTAGIKTFSYTGLIAGTVHYAYFQHKDAALNNSAVVSSGGFTPNAGDVTAPTFSGSINVSNKTNTSYTVSWPTATDNIAVTGYEYRLNGGVWINNATTSVTISGRTPGATDMFEVRAYDAVNNRSAILSTNITLLIGTLSIIGITDWSTGNAKANATGIQADITNISTGNLLVRKTNLSSNASANCIITDASFVDSTLYQVVVRMQDGSIGIWDLQATLS